MKKGRNILIVLLLIVLIAAVYFTFFFHVKCKDISCWDAKLRKCGKATYINTPKDVVWLYTIEGKKEDKCEVNVKILEIKRGLEKTEILKGKEMTCLLPYGVIVKPESNPNLCNGRLKEEMQGLIIQKLHEYVVQNLGEISGELTEIEGVTSQTQTNNVSNINTTNSSS